MPRPKRQLRRPSRLSGVETPAKRSRGTGKKGKVPSGSGVTVGNVGASTNSSSGHDNVSSAASTLNNVVIDVTSLNNTSTGSNSTTATADINGPGLIPSTTSSTTSAVGGHVSLPPLGPLGIGESSAFSTTRPNYASPSVGWGNHNVSVPLQNPTSICSATSLGFPSCVGVSSTIPIYSTANTSFVGAMGLGSSPSSSAQSVMPILGGTFSQPQVLPQVNSQLGFHVPQNVKEKIWAGLYVDLSTLLHDHARAILAREDKGSEFTFAMENGSMVLRQKESRTKKIDSFERWCAAFHTYMSIYIAKQPARAIEMLKYIETIRLAAAQFPGLGWRHYDEQFRLQLESYPSRSWGEVNMELWVTVAAAVSVHPSLNPVLPFQPSQAAKGICFAFNTSKVCHLRFCKFPHKCGKCLRFGHSSIMCRGGHGGNGPAQNRAQFMSTKAQNQPRSENVPFRGQKQAQATKTVAKSQGSLRATNTD